MLNKAAFCLNAEISNANRIGVHDIQMTVTVTYRQQTFTVIVAAM